MIQVLDGEIKLKKLPKTGRLNGGASVSGYDKLMQSDPTLAEEHGWLADTKDTYTFDSETEKLEGPFYEGGAIVYNVVAKPVYEPMPNVDNISLSADKTEITADGVDIVTVTATIEGTEVDTIPCYVTVNGPPAEEAEVSGGEVVREFSTEEEGLFRVDYFCGDKQATMFIKGV